MRQARNRAAGNLMISQDRLREGIELLKQQRASRALQQFTLDIEIALAEGATVEHGELAFDRDLKVVRHSEPAVPAEVMPIKSSA